MEQQLGYRVHDIRNGHIGADAPRPELWEEWPAVQVRGKKTTLSDEGGAQGTKNILEHSRGVLFKVIMY